MARTGKVKSKTSDRKPKRKKAVKEKIVINEK